MEAAASERVVVLDNGAHSLKCGLSHHEHPVCLPNASAKSRAENFTRYGESLKEVKDVTGLVLRRPFDRGFLSNVELEKDIWSSVFNKTLGIDPRETGLLLTEPMLNLDSCQNLMEQVVFEEFGFQSYYSCPAPLLAARYQCATMGNLDASKAGCCLVLDLGYSFSHAVPVFDNRVVNYGVKRLDFGGKAATNLLKEVVSYRSMNVMNESYIVELLKEDACYVSQDADADLRSAQKERKGANSVEYVLPDGMNVFRPHLKTREEDDKKKSQQQNQSFVNPRHAPQIVTMSHERFMVPEVHFNPSDVGINQAGIAELLIQACESVDPVLHPLLLSNVLVMGGSSLFPGLLERLQTELRKVSPIDCKVNVWHTKQAQTCAWYGGKLLVSSGEYRSKAVTRQEFSEHGCDPLVRRFCS